jgi:hypothetical protein
VALAEEESLRVQQAQEGVSVIDYIVDGLEAELELERELGVRFVECDRSLLAPLTRAPQECVRRAAAAPAPARSAAEEPLQAPAPTPRPELSAPRPAAEPAPSGGDVFDFVFLHDRPLSAAGAEMISKITGAMKRTSATAPVVTAVPPPRAKIYVILGGNALKKFFPDMRGAPGQWVSTSSGASVLVTYSPEYILRFGEGASAVKKIKQDMWTSLKTVMQRLAS